MRRLALAGCGAAALLLASCTIEDAGGRRVADSVAAAGAVDQPGTLPAAGNAGQSPQSTGAMNGDSAAGGGPDSGRAPSGNLSPDSVDLGHPMTADSLAATSEQLDVDLARKRVTLLDGDRRVASYPVAIGMSDWPTQTGEWSITQVIWNPEWIPPKETWAKDAKPADPGAPDNPLGRAQLVYDPPRTIHGTNEPASIGKAVSHGSIRMRNPDVVQLAKRVMAAAGAEKDAAW
jgi:lipoprotein-anchoring transpeptidase ErfK/SrfK